MTLSDTYRALCRYVWLQIASNLGQGTHLPLILPPHPMAQRSIDHDARRQRYLKSPSNEGIYIGNPSGLSTYKIEWLPIGDSDGYGHVLADTSHETPSHAILRAVLQISGEDCWVYPDGKWKGPTIYTTSLADMNLRCSGTIPRAGVFRDDFQHVIRNL